MEIDIYRMVLNKAFKCFDEGDLRSSEKLAYDLMIHNDEYNAKVFLLLGNIHFKRADIPYSGQIEREDRLQEYKTAEIMYKRGLEHLPEELRSDQKEERRVKRDILYSLARLYSDLGRGSKSREYYFRAESLEKATQ